LQISKKIKNIRVSGTIKMAELARKMQAEGHDIIELSEGEPDFDTPEFIIESAFDAARNGQTRYTSVPGTIELRKAISKKFYNDNKVEYHVDDIIVGTGAKQLIFNALLATINPGNEVIIPAPYWVSYPDMVKIADGIPVIVPCDSLNGFKITPEKLHKAITNDTRWLLLNSPGNPSGAVYSSEELMALADVLRDHKKVSIMCDDIYEAITFGNNQFYTLVEVAPDLHDRVLTVNGVSKSHAMTGWRIGFAGGPNDLISAMSKIQGQSTTNASSVGQAAALAALEGSQENLGVWNLAYVRRMRLVRDRLSAVPGLALRDPQGAFYHFIKCSDLFGKTTPQGDQLTSDNALCLYLLQYAHVALVAGTEFGCPGYFRLCFAKSDKELIKACNSISEAIKLLT